MRKSVFFILMLLLMVSGPSWTNVWFRVLRSGTNHDRWELLHYEKFETSITVNGLFYETTIHMKANLGEKEAYDYPNELWYCRPAPEGDYLWTWFFRLPESTHITRLEFWNDSTQAFLNVNPVDITTGESLYDPGSAEQPHVLLRQYRNRNFNSSWDQFYQLKIDPVDRDQSIEFKLTYLSPCKAVWDRRRFLINSLQFYFPYLSHPISCQTQCPAVFRFRDLQNPDFPPETITDFSYDWMRQDSVWVASIGPNEHKPSSSLLQTGKEVTAGTFLQTVSEGDNAFYQLSTQPMIFAEDLDPRHIVLCMDLIQKGGRWTKENVMTKIRHALAYTPLPQDSIWVLASDFVVNSLDTSFVSCNHEHIGQRIDQALALTPELNTLPFILQEAVNLLNDRGVAGEIWLISNDSRHGSPNARANDIIDQTLNQAQHPVKFRIMDANGGNHYLYENLFRLSHGTYCRLTGYAEYDWKEAALDCFAPKVSTVQIDPVPFGGLSYSRFDFNAGRQSFHARSRYYQIGLFDGAAPFELRFFGQLNGELFHKEIPLEEGAGNFADRHKDMISDYWYASYIFDDLLEQPQTYETIRYIEDLAVTHNVLTPYSAFVLPGPNGYIGYNRLTAEDSVMAEASPVNDQTENLSNLPARFAMSAWPNPFNPKTRISLELSRAVEGGEKVHILNLMGQTVLSIDLDDYLGQTSFQISWDGKNARGHEVPSGTYFLRYTSRTASHVHKVVLIR